MGKFAVEVVKIAKVWVHPDADRLELASVEGLDYQFCVGKGCCQPGDDVVFFPVDSLLPDPLSEHLGVKNFLSGKAKNRIKTVKLRGQISQGLTTPVEKVREYVEKQGSEWALRWGTSDLAEALGVTKYEPPEISCKAGKLVRLPEGVPLYDIEGAQNFPEVANSLLGEKVCVTEKLEGTNFAISVDREGNLHVCQRSHAIVPDEAGEHDFWKVVRESGFEAKLRELRDKCFPGQHVTLRGELVGPGIQKNIYKLAKRTVFFFDVLVDGTYLPVDAWIDVCDLFGFAKVPVITLTKTLGEWLDGKGLQDASNGGSLLAVGVRREGVVIRPKAERHVPEIGRLIIKQRSPEYLAGTDT
jgi:RNA ligase (TIGR02306 family)